MSAGHAYRLRVLLLLLLALCVSSSPGLARGRPPPARVTVTDISPDAPCCAIDQGNSDEGGQMDGVAANPLNPLIAYVSGEQSGVWKTTNGGASWDHASTGRAPS